MIIITKNKGYYSKIENLDKATYYSLRSLLSYEDKKQVIARLMAKRRLGYIPKHLKAWNGVVYLLEENGKYPTGLTDKIIEFLNNENLKYELIDNQIPDFVYEKLPTKGDIVLRPHQIDALNTVLKNPRGIMHASTGFGKTKTSIKICDEISAYPFLFVIHRLSLLNQTWEEYNKYFDVPIGYIGDGRIDVQKINIATIGTICSALKIKVKSEDKEKIKYTEEQLQQVRDLIKNCKFIIIDEAHHSSATTFQRILKEVKNADYKIGQTATPIRTDGTDIVLEASFGPIIYTKSSSELIQEGFLVKPKIYFINYINSELESKYPKNKKSIPYTTVYKNCIVDNEDYNMMIAQIALQCASKNQSILISVRQIEHGKNIIKAFQKFKHEQEILFLNGETEKDYLKKQIERFSKKEFLILCGTIFDEGFDSPQIDVVINASGGASPIKSIQLVGRALRTSPGKTKAYIYDFIPHFSFLYKNAQDRITTLLEEPEFDIREINS